MPKEVKELFLEQQAFGVVVRLDELPGSFYQAYADRLTKVEREDAWRRRLESDDWRRGDFARNRRDWVPAWVTLSCGTG